MKKGLWLVIVLFFAVAVPTAAFAQEALDKVPLYSTQEVSKEAQKKLNREVADLMRAGNFVDIDVLFASIEGCPSPASTDPLPERCVLADHETDSFLDKIRAKTPEVGALPVVVPEKAFYYGLTRHYTSWLEEQILAKSKEEGSETDPDVISLNEYGYVLNPTKLKKSYYGSFFRTFYRNTPLAQRVEEIMLFIWNDGVRMTDNADLSTINGEVLYDTISTAISMGVKNPYKYADGRFNTEYKPSVFVEQLKRIYGQLYSKNKKEGLPNGKPVVFHKIKQLWWNNILFLTDTPTTKTHVWTVRLLSECTMPKEKPWAAWDTLAILPITNKQQAQVVALYEECKKHNKDHVGDLMMCTHLHEQARSKGYIALDDMEIYDYISIGLRSSLVPYRRN